MPIKELAERRNIPEQFLEQLFSTLRRGGLLTSHRGMKGGYTLSRPADEITVLEVVQTLDGKVGQEADEAGGIWGEGVTALRKVFGQTTIAEVARREADEAGSRHVLHLSTRAIQAAAAMALRPELCEVEYGLALHQAKGDHVDAIDAQIGVLSYIR